MFISPVPAVRRNGKRWDTFRDEPISPEALRKELRFYSFEIAVYDRNEIRNSARFPVKIWIGAALFLKPLFTAEDQPHDSHGCFEMMLNRRWLQQNGGELIHALDVFEKYSSFNLICHSD